jgi:Tol biopolymer transport system component
MKNVTGPQFTPDGNSLIFIRETNGKPGLFISSPPGADAKPLEGVEMPQTLSNFLLISPDGTKLFFGRIAGPPLGVSMASFPRGKPREIQSEKGWVAVGPAAWFPDSRHLALVERSADRDYAYRVVIADTESDARRLIVADIGIVSSVAVSGDGKEVLYSTSGGRDGIDVAEHTIEGARVRVVAQEAFEPSWSRLDGSFVYEVGANGQPSTLWRGADGAEPKLLMADRPQASRFSYSPDGRRLAYNMGVLGVTPGIEMISAKGGQPVRVLSTKVRVGSPCWSSDGNWLVYGQAGKLFKIASQGGGQPTLIKERADQRMICSPRGDFIAYFSSGQVHVMTWDGQHDHAIGSARDYIPPGTFIDNGKSLLVVRRQDPGSADIIDVATGHVRRTIHFELPPTDTIMGLSVHPNGRRVLIASGQPPYDLWKAEGFARPAMGWTRWLQHWDNSN